jgi:hypothetical protein
VGDPHKFSIVSASFCVALGCPILAELIEADCNIFDEVKQAVRRSASAIGPNSFWGIIHPAPHLVMLSAFAV